MSFGRYLFAVATGLEPGDLAGQEGLDGRPLDVVEHDGLQAVVCDVDLDEYGEAPVRQNLEQLPWVEKVARTHDSVVRAVAARATVAPLRLITVCVDDDSVVRRLRQWKQPLRSALERVDGCREWSVKAYVAGPPGPESPDAGDETPTSGRAYLERKREQRSRRETADRDAADAADAVHVALAAHAKASRRLGPQDPQLTGRTEAMTLNGAYLVPHADEEAFRSTVEELRARHESVLLEVAGPWAPYSFAVLEMPNDS
jgi:Gas vesicle synthesis protein GvpL/GvpF